MDLGEEHQWRQEKTETEAIWKVNVVAMEVECINSRSIYKLGASCLLNVISLP